MQSATSKYHQNFKGALSMNRLLLVLVLVLVLDSPGAGSETGAPIAGFMVTRHDF
jgi:hypothetical protein